MAACAEWGGVGHVQGREPVPAEIVPMLSMVLSAGLQACALPVRVPRFLGSNERDRRAWGSPVLGRGVGWGPA